MKVVVVDTGRGRTAPSVDGWRDQLGLSDSDEVALISWNHPRSALPVVDHLVFGPDLQWGRREPVRPNITLPRRGQCAEPRGIDLPRTDPRRLWAAARWRLHRGRRAAARRLAPMTRRLPVHSPMSLVSSTSPVGQRLRARLGVSSDGVATDFAIAVARSRQAAELARWADLVVPSDLRSRKAAWVLAKRVDGPEVLADMTAAARVVRSRR